MKYFIQWDILKSQFLGFSIVMYFWSITIYEGK